MNTLKVFLLLMLFDADSYSRTVALGPFPDMGACQQAIQAGRFMQSPSHENEAQLAAVCFYGDPNDRRYCTYNGKPNETAIWPCEMRAPVKP